MRFAFIEQHVGAFPVRLMRRVLERLAERLLRMAGTALARAGSR